MEKKLSYRLDIEYITCFWNSKTFWMFLSSLKQILQFEDFANHNAFDLLAKYGTSHLVFNDDIQVRSSISAILKLVVLSLTIVSFYFREQHPLFLLE